jgi:hypothetical protein
MARTGNVNVYYSQNFAMEAEAARISLATYSSNALVRSVYESLRYAKDEDFYHYFKALAVLKLLLYFERLLWLIEN